MHSTVPQKDGGTMLNIEHLSVQAGSFALSEINLQVNDGTCFILLGKSGAGKTVFLETLAGRYQVKKGKIRWNGTDITYAAPEKRRIALVYQDYALFPHLTAAQNIAFPLKTAGIPKQIRRERTDGMLESFSLQTAASKYPGMLSGGERQRTALARSLIMEPELLLLDEPLSALDCINKERVQEMLQKVHAACRTTIIQVTHDIEEAQYFADTFAVMKNRTLSPVQTKDTLMSMKKEDIYALLDE